MNKEEFLKSVTVLDTETTHLNAELAEIVEIASAVFDGESWSTKSMLLGARDGIPPEASAKNHISNRMIANMPRFEQMPNKIKELLHWDSAKYYVAHNSKYDQDVLTKSWLEVGDQESSRRCINKSRWICTHRLSKKLLSTDFNDIQYNLNYLRYKLDLPVADELSAHRAETDTLVCALLFEFLVQYAIALDVVKDDNNVDKQIHDLCWGAFTINKWPFGKNKGKLLSEIETDYYLWALENLDSLNDTKDGYDPDLAASVAIELEKRLTS